MVGQQGKQSAFGAKVTTSVSKSFTAVRTFFAASTSSGAATSLVCFIFTLVVLAPVVMCALIMFNHQTWGSYSPNLYVKMWIQVISGSGDDFSRLNYFIIPFFALLAGLKSRTGGQSLFFTLFVCLSLLGAVGSLTNKYFLLSDDGTKLFQQTTWIGEAKISQWKEQAKTFFNASFQTFLSFV